MLSPTVTKILEITSIEHDGSLDSIVQGTQKAWLRKPGVERWQMEKKYEQLRPQLEPLFEPLGVIDEVQPSQKNYDQLLILGATVFRMRTRLAYALKLWDSGIRFNKLVFLVGQRPRDPEVESPEKLFDRNNTELAIRKDWQEPTLIPATETDMARMVVDQTDLPKDFKDSVEIIFMDTPMQPTPDGGTRRPSTADTIQLWLQKTHPQGPILAISNQPYVGYQHAVIKSFVPKELIIETAGPKADSKQSVDVMLDNLARWLFQENILQKQSK